MARPPEAHLSTGPLDPTSGIVVSPHHLASSAGVSILERGGTAVDAAIAVDAVLAVVLPDTCGPGGDLFAIIHRPGMDRPVALNSSGRAGSGVTADDLRDKGLGELPYRSPWSVTVPGCVDGWIALADRFGSLPLADSLRPAIHLASEGFPVSDELADSLDRIVQLIGSQESAPSLYPEGAPPGSGDVLRRPALGRVLEAVASDGRDGFYRSAVAEGIKEATLGAITDTDLERVQSEWVEPAGLELFGRTAWTIPPNSQGYLTLATLAIFEQLDPPQDPNDPLFNHLLIEAYRSVAWERVDTVADPSTAPPVAELLDPSRLEARAGQISPHSVTRWPTPREALGGTAYMTVVDQSGMGVSFIQSNFAGIGSGLSAGDTGVWLHNRGAGFNLIPGHPNEYTPGQRPLHTLSPTLWTRDGELALLLGTRGGDQQPQFLAQFAALHFHADHCTDDAQAVPRWNMEQPLPGTDSDVRVESRMAGSTIAGLTDRGHSISMAGEFEAGWGPVSAIDLENAADTWKGSADPRVSTSAALSTRG